MRPKAADSQKTWDAIIVGGGPAGLAAGVYLGRYLRSTLILDEKKPRTRWHRPTAHNVLGFPAGIQRNQLLDWGRDHVAKYECVTIRQTTVESLSRHQKLFQAVDSERRRYLARGLILCPGIEYRLPEDIPNIYDYAGYSIWHCPECDGYKCLGKHIAVISHGRGTADMALNVSIWCDKVTLCTHGNPPEFDREVRQKLKAADIATITSRITALHGIPDDGILHALEFDDGSRLPVVGAFINIGINTPTELLRQLPLKLENDRWIIVDHRMRTNIPCCYAAGDIICNAQTQLSVAMGTGATAAIWLHRELRPPSQTITK